jgi:putative methylase
MGASKSFGIDVDPKAVKVAQDNAAAMDVDVELVAGDVAALEGRFDTVIQNPPFGAQTRHADRTFMEAAVRLAPVVYSLHNDGTEEFVQGMVSSLGAKATAIKRYKFEIPYAFDFHRKANETISVVLLKLER